MPPFEGLPEAFPSDHLRTTMSIVSVTIVVPIEAMWAIIFCVCVAFAVFVVLPILIGAVAWFLSAVFKVSVRWAGLSRNTSNKIVIKLLGAEISVTVPHIMIFVFLAVFLLGLAGYGILRMIPGAE